MATKVGTLVKMKIRIIFMVGEMYRNLGSVVRLEERRVGRM